jgi:hypothetical protein
MSEPTMSEGDVTNLRRQIKIKTGVVKRYACDISVRMLAETFRGRSLFKEHNLYNQEATQQKVKVDKMVADNADEYDIKNAVGRGLHSPSPNLPKALALVEKGPC